MKAIIKFIPVIVLAGMMISGQDALLAAPVAVVVAIAVAMLTEKIKLSEYADFVDSTITIKFISEDGSVDHEHINPMFLEKCELPEGNLKERFLELRHTR